MSRATLPQRRPAELFDVDYRGASFTVTLGRYVDEGTRTIGGIGEIFLSCRKASSDLAGVARDAAVAISIALQHGASIEVLAGAMTRTEDGSAAGLAGVALDEILKREAGKCPTVGHPTSTAQQEPAP